MKNKTNIDMSNLCKDFDSCSGSCTSCAYTIGYQDGSKETAEKFSNLPNSEILTVVYDYEEIKVVKLEKLQEIAEQFGVEITTDDNCKHYDKANMRCNGAKCTPECYCNGHKSECTEYPETRK